MEKEARQWREIYKVGRSEMARIRAQTGVGLAITRIYHQAWQRTCGG